MKKSVFWTEKGNCLCFVLQIFQLHPRSWRARGWLAFRKGKRPLNSKIKFFFLSVCICRILFSIMVPDTCSVSLLFEKAFFPPCSSVCNLHCNRLKLVSCIKLCLWLNLGFSPVTPHLWMTHNKQGHQKNIMYIFIQICRVFVSNFFTALLHSSLPCNESYCICLHTWQEEWLCIEGELNAKQIERVSPAINLLRAELLYLAVILCQPLGHFWYYDFLPPCKHQVLLNGYSGLGAELDLSGTGSKRGSASWGAQGLFFLSPHSIQWLMKAAPPQSF